MATGIETMIAEILIDTIGSPLLLGVLSLVLFILYGSFNKLSLGCFVVALLPLIFVFANGGYVPLILKYIAALGCGVLMSLAFVRLIGR